MPRHRFHAFITPRELGALLADEAPKHAAEVYCRLDHPARLMKVGLSELGEVAARERAREMYLVLPGAGPDHPQDWNFLVRNPRETIVIEIGDETEDEGLGATSLSTDPDGSAMVVLRELERAVARACNTYVRISETLGLKRLYWSPGVAGVNLRDCEAVTDEVAKLERAAAAAKRRPKWKPR